MRADAQHNRNRIVEAGRAQIASHGTDFAFSAIAESAGVGIATLYRNFPTREALIAAVLRDQEQRTLSAVQSCSEIIASNPEEAWKRFTHALADLRPGALVSVFASAFVSADGLSPEIAPEREEGLASTQAFIDAAIDAGLVRDDLTAMDFHADLAVLTRPLPHLGATLESQIHRLVDVYLRGLRP